MCKVGLTRGGGLDPLLEKWSVSSTDHFWPFFPKWVQPPHTPHTPELEGVYELRTFVWTTRFLCVAFLLFTVKMSIERDSSRFSTIYAKIVIKLTR